MIGRRVRMGWCRYWGVGLGVFDLAPPSVADVADWLDLLSADEGWRWLWCWLHEDDLVLAEVKRRREAEWAAAERFGGWLTGGAVGEMREERRDDGSVDLDV